MKIQIATLGQKMKNLQSERQKHRVNALEGSLRTVDPNQKGRQNANQFCNYCRTNGHTPKLMQQENTKRRTETNQKRNDCREKSHVCSGL